MSANINEILTGSLGEVNVGLSGAIGMINPLAAQIDAAISLGLGPIQNDLSAAFDASLALQISFTDPITAIKDALAGLLQLQASLTAALALPSPELPSISAGASLSAALSAKLGALQILIDAMLAVKIPALAMAADMLASLNAGAVVLLSFDGMNVFGQGNYATLSEIGSAIAAKFSGDIGTGGAIHPNQQVSGLIMVTAAPTACASLNAIIPIKFP